MYYNMIDLFQKNLLDLEVQNIHRRRLKPHNLKHITLRSYSTQIDTIHILPLNVIFLFFSLQFPTANLFVVLNQIILIVDSFLSDTDLQRT